MTDAERIVYTARLASAEQAWHDMTIGGQPRVIVDSSGERVEFFASNRGTLRAYILELQLKLGMETSITGPMGVRIC